MCFCRMILVERTQFVVLAPSEGGECEIDPQTRLCVCVDMCLFRGRVSRNTSIGVDCLLSISCVHIESARILDDPSCLSHWLVSRTLGFYDPGFGSGCNFLCRSFLGCLFVGGIACLCCVPDPLIEKHTFVFRDWVFRSNCIWAFLHLPWPVCRLSLGGSCWYPVGPSSGLVPMLSYLCYSLGFGRCGVGGCGLGSSGVLGYLIFPYE